MWLNIPNEDVAKGDREPCDDREAKQSRSQRQKTDAHKQGSEGQECAGPGHR